MAKCEVCEKKLQNGRRISITRSQVSRRAKRSWKPNIKKIRIVEDNGNHTTVKICTKCLRSGKVTRAV
ncbi:MAG: 50S ribosomal protein L28 [Lachnospirales bacterium]